jgi:hypothetical protein
MSRVGDWIREVIALGLAVELKARGFSRKGNSFVKNVGETALEVNVQSSQFNSASEGRFTLNLSVVRGSAEQEFFRERIGKLMPNKMDHWWAVDAWVDRPQLAKEVAAAFAQYGAPWMHAYT